MAEFVGVLYELKKKNSLCGDPICLSVRLSVSDWTVMCVELCGDPMCLSVSDWTVMCVQFGMALLFDVKEAPVACKAPR